jgi:serine/threonine protein kinase
LKAGSYTDPRHLALIISPVADGNLRQYLNNAESSFDLTNPVCLRNWFGCLATAVQYIHGMKIRHRDIKPENILVHGSRVLLVDFELCHDWKDLSRSTTSADCGHTPLYAAPEVLLHMDSNSSSDIWSLGCVFLEMVTVLKGKDVSQMRALCKSQSKSEIFCNNRLGISQWLELLEQLSELGNEPLFWIAKMLQHDKDFRPKAGAVVDLIWNSEASGDYFCTSCQPVEELVLLPVTPCSVSDSRMRSKRVRTQHFLTNLYLTIIGWLSRRAFLHSDHQDVSKSRS